MAGSADISRSILLQLPLNPSAPLESTGNVPLAGATLAAAASLPPSSLVDQDDADTLGDRELLNLLLQKDPALVAFTLYMWNAERSAWLARALKNEKPDIVTVGGGPEVSRDNDWLIREGGFDLLVAGEGEGAAAEVLDPAGAAAISRETGGFLQTDATDFPPGFYPNPWLEGYLDPSGRSVLLETVRGCAAGCVYCSYRRSHPHPRIMEAKEVIGLLRTFAENGTDEVVFLDPTFNARPDLAHLLKGMSGLGIEFFGEMRGDLIGPEIASMIMDAGFRSVEIGLQSCNRNSLELAGRPGDPMMVLEGAMNLKRAGVTPVIDIMLGLPGDTPGDAVRTAMMLRDRDLHHDLQVFHISILPGTALRGRCGCGAMDRPPYYMFDPPLMGGFAPAREEIADIAGYDLDLAARPILFEDWPATVTLDLDEGPAPAVAIPSFRQSSLRISSNDLWEKRHRLIECVRTRREADPFCVLDLILMPCRSFPLDLVEMIRTLDTPLDYSGRTARALGREGDLRVAILVRDASGFDPHWIVSAAVECTVAVDAGHPSMMPNSMWSKGVCVRLPGEDWDMAELASLVPSIHQVYFTERSMEEKWSAALDL